MRGNGTCAGAVRHGHRGRNLKVDIEDLMCLSYSYSGTRWGVKTWYRKSSKEEKVVKAEANAAKTIGLLIQNDRMITFTNGCR